MDVYYFLLGIYLLKVFYPLTAVPLRAIISEYMGMYIATRIKKHYKGSVKPTTMSIGLASQPPPVGAVKVQEEGGQRAAAAGL